MLGKLIRTAGLTNHVQVKSTCKNFIPIDRMQHRKQLSEHPRLSKGGCLDRNQFSRLTETGPIQQADVSDQNLRKSEKSTQLFCSMRIRNISKLMLKMQTLRR